MGHILTEKKYLRVVDHARGYQFFGNQIAQAIHPIHGVILAGGHAAGIGFMQAATHKSPMKTACKSIAETYWPYILLFSNR